MRMGCCGGLSLAVLLLSKAVKTAVGASSFWPTAEDPSWEAVPVPAREESPVPSISSQGDSWISRYYGNRGETASSGAAQQGEASSLPSAAEANPVVIASPAISQGELLGESSNPQAAASAIPLPQMRGELSAFLSSFSAIRARSNFILDVEEKLGLRQACPRKLCQIRLLMRDISEAEQPTSARKAAELLLKRLQAWEADQANDA